MHSRNGRLWRVVERRPRPGDFHPLTASDVREVMHGLRGRFTYGLTQVELRSRVGAVGWPFGFYVPADKSVVLYSVPVGDWRMTNKPKLAEYFQWYGAVTVVEDDELVIRWEDLECLKFNACWTLMHELGHHFDYNYRCRRPYPKKDRDHERSAEAHAFRMAQWECIQARFPHLAKEDGEPPTTLLEEESAAPSATETVGELSECHDHD